ncbi:hypothetical protein BCR34DRAFT_211288 [Clohesyomyces aquaticus]|uniref:Uncharacterized protein n=1 Tax=Clohesyomyces aquaticus TaxID=1231657 RepID=A0A1Y1ZX15_9PLEO|nr:hypothetical protein BCR34DRAFT_211288 [Clohesyomyces aquaticus]
MIGGAASWCLSYLLPLLQISSLGLSIPPSFFYTCLLLALFALFYSTLLSSPRLSVILIDESHSYYALYFLSLVYKPFSTLCVPLLPPPHWAFATESVSNLK